MANQKKSSTATDASNGNMDEASSSPSHRGNGSSRSYSSMSDFFHYCRNPKEHEIFNAVRDSYRHDERKSMMKTFCVKNDMFGRFKLLGEDNLTATVTKESESINVKVSHSGKEVAAYNFESGASVSDLVAKVKDRWGKAMVKSHDDK